MEDLVQTNYALDTFYFLVMGALVMFMAPGFAMLEAGLVRQKNVATIQLGQHFSRVPIDAYVRVEVDDFLVSFVKKTGYEEWLYRGVQLQNRISKNKLAEIRNLQSVYWKDFKSFLFQVPVFILVTQSDNEVRLRKELRSAVHQCSRVVQVIPGNYCKNAGVGHDDGIPML